MHYYSFPDPMSGRFLRGLRQTMGLRQEKLAGMLGVNQSSLNRWEHGKYAIPSGIVRELEVIYRDFLADIVSLDSGEDVHINRDWLDVVLFWGRRFEIRWADELNLMNEVVAQNMPQLE